MDKWRHLGSLLESVRQLQGPSREIYEACEGPLRAVGEGLAHLRVRETELETTIATLRNENRQLLKEKSDMYGELSTERQSIVADLEQRTVELEHLRNEIKRHEDRNASSSSEVAKREYQLRKQIEELKEDVRTREKVGSNMQISLAALEDEARNMRARESTSSLRLYEAEETAARLTIENKKLKDGNDGKAEQLSSAAEALLERTRQYDEIVKTLQQQVQDMQHALTVVREEKTVLEERVAWLAGTDNREQELGKELERLRGLLAVTDGERAQQDVELRRLREELETAAERRGHGERRIRGFDEEMAERNALIIQLQGGRAALALDVERLQDDVRNAERERDEAVAALTKNQQSREAILPRIVSLHDRYMSANIGVAELKAMAMERETELSEQIAELEADLELLRGQLERNREDHDATENARVAIEEEAETLRVEHVRLTKLTAELTTEVQRLGETVATGSTDIRRLEDRLLEQAKEMSSWQTEVGGARAQIAEARGGEDVLRKELAELRDEMRRRHRTYEEDKAVLTHELEDLQKRYQAVIECLEYQYVLRLKNSLKDSQQRRGKLEQDIKAAEKNMELLKKDNEQQRREADSEREMAADEARRSARTVKQLQEELSVAQKNRQEPQALKDVEERLRRECEARRAVEKTTEIELRKRATEITELKMRLSTVSVQLKTQEESEQTEKNVHRTPLRVAPIFNDTHEDSNDDDQDISHFGGLLSRPVGTDLDEEDVRIGEDITLLKALVATVVRAHRARGSLHDSFRSISGQLKAELAEHGWTSRQLKIVCIFVINLEEVKRELTSQKEKTIMLEDTVAEAHKAQKVSARKVTKTIYEMDTLRRAFTISVLPERSPAVLRRG